MAKIEDAIAAYTAAAQAQGTGAGAGTGETAGGGFADLVKGAAQDAVSSIEQGEEAAKAALAGKADVRDVVTAVTNAELTLETVVNLRDKVINAYNEIIKMPV